MNYRLPTFRTERLTLRPFEEEDFDSLRLLETDLDVVKYLGNGKIRNAEETRRYLEKHFGDYKAYGLGLYAVIENKTEHFIGRSGLIPWEIDRKLEWEVGCTLTKNSWGSGYASELADFLKHWAFKHMEIQYLIGIINPQNTRSIRVANKMGLEFWKFLDIEDQKHSVYRLFKDGKR